MSDRLKRNRDCEISEKQHGAVGFAGKEIAPVEEKPMDKV